MYQRILVPIDGSETAWRGFDEAVCLASAIGACVHLVQVFEFPPGVGGVGREATGIESDFNLRRDEARAFLDAAVGRAALCGVRCDFETQDTGAFSIQPVLLDAVRRWNADLVVIGSHRRRGLERVMLGSDAEQMARRSPVPVLVVGARLPDRTSTDEADPHGDAAVARIEPPP